MKRILDDETKPKVYILHENREWILPLIKGLEMLDTPFEEWFLDRGTIDIAKAPPLGVFYNRMSASSHTRGNRYAIEMTGPVLAWLTTHNRKVLNGSRALQLEVRKIEQYMSLQQFGIRTPKTIAAVGKSEIIRAVYELNLFPFILKPNRGGKGLDVRLFQSIESLKQFLNQTELSEISLDGVFLVQEYIEPKNNRIIRLEFVDGRFLYAVSVDTSDGFELCPADDCQIGDVACPTSSDTSNKFEILEDFTIPEIGNCEAFLKANAIDIAGIEFVESATGARYFYDVNTNTNYNREAEIRSGLGVFGMNRIAELLSLELEKETKSSTNRNSGIQFREEILA